MEQDPTLKIQNEKPLRPESLKGFYELMIKICPVDNDNENTYLKYIIDVLKQSHIELQYREQRLMIEKEGLNFMLTNNLSINNYWTATDKYLKNIGIASAEINKFDLVISKGFK